MDIPTSRHLFQKPNYPTFDPFVNLNTALVVGLKPNSSELKIQLKTTKTTFTAEFQNGEWQVSGNGNDLNTVEMDNVGMDTGTLI